MLLGISHEQALIRKSFGAREKLAEAIPSDFRGIEKLGISLSRVRIMRVDTLEELKCGLEERVRRRREESAMKKQVAETIHQSITKQMSIRMSVRNMLSSPVFSFESLLKGRSTPHSRIPR